jgi:hypothetical protein
MGEGGQHPVARVPTYPSSERFAADAGPSPDGFPEKLAKYVPAEVLAFYVPALAIGGVRQDVQALLLVTVVAAVGVVGYLAWSARSLPAENRPPTWFYMLALVAFGGWAVGTVPELGADLKLSAAVSSVLLPITVFLVPAIDLWLTSARRP